MPRVCPTRGKPVPENPALSLDCLTSSPTDSLRVRKGQSVISLYYQRRSQVGFMDGFDLFDTRSLEVSTIDARPMDSRHRMVLVTTKQALEDTGIDLDQLNGSREGFEIGIASSQYLNLLKTGEYGIGHLSRAAGMAVDHLSFRFGLSGREMSLEWICASSLADLHQAVADPRRCKSDLALPVVRTRRSLHRLPGKWRIPGFSSAKVRAEISIPRSTATAFERWSARPRSARNESPRDRSSQTAQHRNG